MKGDLPEGRGHSRLEDGSGSGGGLAAEPDRPGRELRLLTAVGEKVGRPIIKLRLRRGNQKQVDLGNSLSDRKMLS